MPLVTCAGPGSRLYTGGGDPPQEDWQFDVGNYEAAFIPLEIMHPQAGVTSPYTRAYPGIAWERPVVVLGGSWPYKCELVQAPSGMTVGETIDIDAFNSTGLIGQTYSVLSWANPTTSGSPHTVELLVTDQEGNTDSVTWSLTVTTTGFVFVDAATGNNGNAGTLASPKANLSGVYGANKAAVSFNGQHCYIRAGTYEHDILPIESGTRVTWTSNKPYSFEAYPGETVEIDCANAHWNMETPGDLSFIGLRFTGLNSNGGYKYLQWGAGTDRVLVYDNYFGPATGGAAGSNSAIMFVANGTTTTDSAVIRNEFDDPTNIALVETYASDGFVIEGNTATNYSGNGFYPKILNTNFSIRANREVTGCTGYLVVIDTYDDNGPIEITYNLSIVGSGDEHIQVGREANNAVDVFIARNTLISGSVNMDNAVGPCVFSNNVRQRDTTDADGITYTASGNEATVTGTGTDLVATSGIANATTGRLTGTYATDNLGTDGYELAVDAP